MLLGSYRSSGRAASWSGPPVSPPCALGAAFSAAAARRPAAKVLALSAIHCLRFMVLVLVEVRVFPLYDAVFRFATQARSRPPRTVPLRSVWLIMAAQR